jgi:hypothetical protein
VVVPSSWESARDPGLSLNDAELVEKHRWNQKLAIGIQATLLNPLILRDPRAVLVANLDPQQCVARETVLVESEIGDPYAGVVRLRHLLARRISNAVAQNRFDPTESSDSRSALVTSLAEWLALRFLVVGL